MTDIDNIIGSIDRALWRVRDRSVNNVTPFTYRDGLTYLEVLERIRGAVVECIEYIGKFGEEQDKIIKDLNTKVSTFITEMEKVHDGWNKDIEEKRKTVLSTIEEFKSRLIAVALTPAKSNRYNLNSAFLSTTMMDGTTHFMATVKLTEKMEERLDSVNSSLTSSLNSGLADRYTKSESNNLFVAKEVKHGIIIGNSNATYPWFNRVLTEQGYIPHNHAIGGAAFYKGWSGAYINQLNTAKNQAVQGGYMDKIKCVSFVCMLNDIRFGQSISETAKECADFVKANWPNAKVICIPVILNRSSLNISKETGRSVVMRTNEFAEAFADLKPLICNGSKSWFWESSDAAGHNWIKGNDEVHLTDEGYERAANYAISWLNGGDGWRNLGWTNLEKYGEDANAPIKTSMKNLWVKREFDKVTVSGNFAVKAETSIDTNLWWFPSWARPAGEVLFTGFSGYREPAYFRVTTSGVFGNVTKCVAGTNYFIEATYSVW